MSRPFSFAEKEYYHCFSRGTEKRKIFLSNKDYERFIALLFICNNKEKVHLSNYSSKNRQNIFNIKRDETLVDIGVYCLMSNHFHLLLHEKEEGGISTFMQKLMTAYTMYFNTKYKRSGALFSGRFKAEHADTDNYLKYLFSYIHLNPVKLIQRDWKDNGIKNITKAKKFSEEYVFSSYLDYLEEDRPQKVILNKSAFPKYFEDRKSIEGEIFDWLTVKVQP